MAVADDARDFPGVAGLAPNVNELKRAGFFFAAFLVDETVHADPDRAIILDWIDFECAGNKVTVNIRRAGKEFSKTFGRLRVGTQSNFVVIEFDIVSEERHYAIGVMGIKGIEYRGVHLSDGLE